MDGPPPGVDDVLLNRHALSRTGPKCRRSTQRRPRRRRSPPTLDKCDACFVLWRSPEGVLEAEDGQGPDGRRPGGRLSRGADGDEAQLRDVGGRVDAPAIEQATRFARRAWERRARTSSPPSTPRKGPRQRRLRGRLPTDGRRVTDQPVLPCRRGPRGRAHELLLDGGHDAGRAAFCSGTRKDCRGDAVEEAAKRQSIADILSGVVRQSSRRSRHRVVPDHGWISIRGINDEAEARKKRWKGRRAAAAEL